MPLSARLREFQHLSPQQWIERGSRTVPRALSVILVIAIAWQLVQFTWLFLDRSPSALPPIMPPSGPPLARRQNVDVQALVDAHLFGVPPAQGPTDASAAPQSQINLVLAGTWAEQDPMSGYAFIGESANTARMYAVGTAVRSGTKLHSVYPDRAILDNGGRLEALILPRLSNAGSVSAPAPIASANPQPGRPFTDNLRRIAETNPSAFAEVIRPQPVFANGVQRGYRVYPGRNRQQFAKLGLQPGDLVMSINGTPLDDPQRGMEIFNTMGASDRVTVTVERSGQMQELTLNTGEISLGEEPPSPMAKQPLPAQPAPNDFPQTD